MQLAIANQEKERLLNRLLEKPEPEEKVDTTNLQPIRTAQIPWNVRRQMLEAAERQRAKDIAANERESKEAAKSNQANSRSVDELEKEIGILTEANEQKLAEG